MTTIENSLFDKSLARFAEYREWARLAREQTGKSLLIQAREILALRRAGGQCGITDYYWFRLYDADHLCGHAEDFLGWRLQDSFNFALNPRHVVLPAWDKLVFHQLATAAGLPVVPLKAVYHPGPRLSLPGLVQHLRTAAEVEAYLRCRENYPLFAKPAYSQQGVGVLHLCDYDRAQDSLLRVDGSRLPVTDFVKRVFESVDRRYHKPECGFLFQEPLRLAPEIERLTGWPAICGVRIVCLNGPAGVVPIGAAWKIAVPPNHVDNFHMGSYGNLVAEVDLESGEIGRMIDGLGPGAHLLDTHPRTGLRLSGLRLPGWTQLLRVCREAGPVFPLMKVHHWDFALSDRGPVILELNDMGGTQIVQLFGRGLLSEVTRDFLRQHVDRKVHPWINHL